MIQARYLLLMHNNEWFRRKPLLTETKLSYLVAGVVVLWDSSHVCFLQFHIITVSSVNMCVVLLRCFFHQVTNNHLNITEII